MTNSNNKALLEAAGFSSDRMQRLDAVMQNMIDTNKYVGISLMVARHGKIIKDSQYGYQDLESRAPLKKDAIFRLASTTKPVTSAALMTLFEEGKWQLDDPVTNFIPEFAGLKVATPDGDLVPIAHPMTMRHILSSSAGFPGPSIWATVNPDVNKAYEAMTMQDGTLEDMIGKLSKLPLETQPGTKFRYGLVQNIQGAIIERISGQPFNEFISDRLFKPLGMVDTDFYIPAPKLERGTPLYTYDSELNIVLAEQQGIFADRHDTMPSFFAGDWGLYSTTADYMRFALMIANGGSVDGVHVLAPSTVKLMMSNLLAEGVQVEFLHPWAGTGYGAGMCIALDPAHAPYSSGAIGKGSVFWTGAHGTWFWVDPVNDLAVVGMSQIAGAAAAHVGMPHPAPDIRVFSQSLTYQALVDPSK